MGLWLMFTREQFVTTIIIITFENSFNTVKSVHNARLFRHQTFANVSESLSARARSAKKTRTVRNVQQLCGTLSSVIETVPIVSADMFMNKDGGGERG